jgi:hypothetical protein
MLALSFKSLGVNTYGLDYDAINKVISKDVKTSGVHFVGFMHSFIVYPSTYQTFDFSDNTGASRGAVEARTKDGLMVSFRANFQYKLSQKDLVKLYKKFGADYKTPCIRFAVDLLSDQATKFEAQ